jgi:hypothetical protein
MTTEDEMFWRKQKKEHDLDFFRSSEDWETFEILYFRELSFFDIEDSIDSYKRKRKISREDAQKEIGYSRAYIDGQGRLRRLDEIGSGLKPNETYVQYDGNLPVRVRTFWLGFSFHGKRVSSGGELDREWTYRYDDSGRLAEMISHVHPDMARTYYWHNEHFRHQEYEYDDKGLLRTYQWSFGKGVYGKAWANPRGPGLRSKAERAVAQTLSLKESPRLREKVEKTGLFL